MSLSAKDALVLAELSAAGMRPGPLAEAARQAVSGEKDLAGALAAAGVSSRDRWEAERKRRELEQKRREAEQKRRERDAREERERREAAGIPRPSDWTYLGKNGAGHHEFRAPKDGSVMIWVPPGE